MKIKDAIKKTIAKNIKNARIASNMTQAEAAEKLGITAQAVSNYERGINGIENSMLLQMCLIYNTNMSFITGEENENIFSPSKLQLTEGEQFLIELFRRVPEDQKTMVLQMIRAALETK